MRMLAWMLPAAGGIVFFCKRACVDWAPCKPVRHLSKSKHVSPIQYSVRIDTLLTELQCSKPHCLQAAAVSS